MRSKMRTEEAAVKCEKCGKRSFIDTYCAYAGTSEDPAEWEPLEPYVCPACGCTEFQYD